MRMLTVGFLRGLANGTEEFPHASGFLPDLTCPSVQSGMSRHPKKLFAVISASFGEVPEDWGNEARAIVSALDGTNNGKPLPVGGYILVIEAINAEGETFMENGMITLVR